MTVTLQLLSDLHLEAPKGYDVFTIAAKSQYLALLGDIGSTRDAGYLTFIRTQLRQFSIVFLVLGNHEPYYSDWASTKQQLRDFETDTRYDLTSDLTILGCTLFSHVPGAQEESVSMGVNDFYYIADWDVARHNAAHASDLAWLDKQIAALHGSGRRIIVLTHYSPTTSVEAADTVYGSGSKISSAFSTDLSRAPSWLSDGVKVWAFGHTHYNCDFVDGHTGKRVLTNQRGYYFKQAEGFDGDKCIEIVD
ncbi:calcineurin-like phosphoesterase [Phlyctema vagabunda]|uniref:Calcineurin-like phosphoesterase n=1 Tax=Phlyctema vagabunda TaxID=108571 RepID=A0ABR4P3D6_9HELO